MNTSSINRVSYLAIALAVNLSPCLGQSVAPKDERSTQLRTAEKELSEAVNDRYSRVAASSSAYIDALADVVSFRATLNQEGRRTDETLKPDWIMRLSAKYDALAAACGVCAKDAERISAANWTNRYAEEIAKLKSSQTEDAQERDRASAEKERLLTVPDTKRTIVQQSRLGMLEHIIVQTETRLKIYAASLRIFERINLVVEDNDRLVSDYKSIIENIQRSYKEMSKTLLAVHDLQSFREIEAAVDRIVNQTRLLREKMERVKTEWESIRAAIEKTIGA